SYWADFSAQYSHHRRYRALQRGGASQQPIQNVCVTVFCHLRTVLLTSLFFIRGAQFKDKNVLVVGSRSSAADSCSFLVNGGAGDIYMSHRGGVQMVTRFSRSHSN